MGAQSTEKRLMYRISGIKPTVGRWREGRVDIHLDSYCEIKHSKCNLVRGEDA